MPFPSLLQTLQMNRRTGELAVFIGDRVGGRMWLQDGDIIDAECGATKGEEAAYRMLVLEEGQFRVDFGPVDRVQTICASIHGLLMEGMRRLDHMNRLSAGLPRLDSHCLSVPELAPPPGLAREIFNQAIVPVTIRELIDGQTDGLAALEIVSGLFSEGALVEHTLVVNAPTLEDLGVADSVRVKVQPDLVYDVPTPQRRRSRLRPAIVASTALALMAASGLVLYAANSDAPTSAQLAAEPEPELSVATSLSAPPEIQAAYPCPDGMVLVEPSQFTMGTNSNRQSLADSLPPHPVELSSFCVQRNEVTASEYRACSNRGQCLRAYREPHIDRTAGDKRGASDSSATCAEAKDLEHAPIDCVTQRQAADYCAWRGSRLPTEAQWEYLARSTEELGVAGVTHLPAEWTADHPYPYSAKPVKDPTGLAAGTTVVVRGARLPDGTTDPAYRRIVGADTRLPSLGFRCVADPS